MLRLAGFVGAFLLAGCAGGGYTLSTVHHNPEFGHHKFAYHNQNRDLRTEIRGNPFPGISDAQVAESVTGAMRGRNAFGYTNFTTTPGPDASPVTRFVISFNATGHESGRTLCTTDTTPTSASSDGTLRMAMAYCIRDLALGWVSGRVSQPSGPDDPGFRNMIGQSVQALIPARNPLFSGRQN